MVFESRFESGNLRLVHKVIFLVFAVPVNSIFSKMIMNTIYFYAMILTAAVTPNGSFFEYLIPGRIKPSNSIY